MCVGKRFKNASNKLNRLLDRESGLPLKDIEIAFTRDELHRDEEPVLLGVHVHV